MLRKMAVSAAALALGLGIAGITEEAKATLALQLNGTTIQDNGVGDLNLATGIILFSGTVDGFLVNVDTAISYPVGGTSNVPFIDLSSINGFGANGNLTLRATQTDFTTTGPVEFNASIGGTINPTSGSTLAASWYYDENNAQFGASNQINGTLSFPPFGPNGSFSGDVSETIDTNGLYSLTNQVVLTLPPGSTSSVSFDSQLTTAVPEPGSLAILIGSLGVLGIFGRRRRNG